MPNGSHTLGEVKAARVEIDCKECGRHGSYSTERLIGRFGAGMRMPDLKTELVNCPHLDARNLTPRKAMYSRETRLSWGGKR